MKVTEVKAQDTVLYQGEIYKVAYRMLNTVRIRNDKQSISVSYSQIEKHEQDNRKNAK